MNKSLVLLIFLMLITSCHKNTQTKKEADTFQSAQWQLIPELSKLSFLSTKNKTFTEEHTLQFSRGEINSDYGFMAVLDLDSVDTLIPIRDERLRNILFNTKEFPEAKISTTIPNDFALNQAIELPFRLELHGHSKTMTAIVMVQMADEQLVVINYEPIAINTKDFGMDDAINQLTQIAGLQSIDYTALVDFKLVFEK